MLLFVDGDRDGLKRLLLHQSEQIRVKSFAPFGIPENGEATFAPHNIAAMQNYRLIPVFPEMHSLKPIQCGL